MGQNESDRLAALLEAKREFGDLNSALVVLYVRVHGPTSISGISQDIGLSRGVVRRALQGVSEKDS